MFLDFYHDFASCVRARLMDGVLKLGFNPTTAVLKALSAESPSYPNTLNQNWQ